MRDAARPTPARAWCCGAAAVAVLLGCQVVPEAPALVVPLYATRTDALAVARGQPGAVPIALPGPGGITLAGPGACTEGVARVRTEAGQQGWVPLASLPVWVCPLTARSA